MVENSNLNKAPLPSISIKGTCIVHGIFGTQPPLCQWCSSWLHFYVIFTRNLGDLCVFKCNDEYEPRSLRIISYTQARTSPNKPEVEPRPDTNILLLATITAKPKWKLQARAVVTYPFIDRGSLSSAIKFLDQVHSALAVYISPKPT